mgnify:CR=1 FL=1
MATINVYKQTGEVAGTMNLDDFIARCEEEVRLKK